MKLFFLTLPANIIECFEGRRILFHLLAIGLTCVLVTSGFDWRFFTATRAPVLRSLAFPAVHLGGLLPIVLPLALIALGSLLSDSSSRVLGWAIGQAEVIGALIAAAYKALTGRAHPTHAVGPDLTHTFRFGILRGGVFWGWPSSHTTIAFAMAVTVFTMFPKHKWVGYVVILYALYVGVGVSMTIHWFSDFIAGAIFGSLVGTVVGKSFLEKASTDANTASSKAQIPIM